MARKICLCTSVLLAASLAMSCGTNDVATNGVTKTNEVITTQSVQEVADNTQETTETTEAEEVEEIEEEEQTQPKVYFSVKSGFYQNPFELTLFCPVENSTIYYTTDGSIPTDSSTKYEGVISLKNRTSEKNNLSARTDHQVGANYVPQDNVTKANVIRAVAYFEDGTSSEITNGTFFVGVDREAQYGDVPVISLITEEANLYDYETGIYVLGKTYDDWVKEDPANAQLADWQSVGNFSNKGMDWERPVAFEYIGTKNNYHTDLGMRIKGASTRGYFQKSLKLIAREQYGKKNIKFPLINDNMKSDGSGEVEKYKSFVLRNGGNDSGFAKLRDPLLQSLIKDRNLETQQSTPCVVFINGEYFGLYAITEDYSNNYFENNYEINSDNVVVVKCGEIDEGNDDDFVLFEDMFNYITENDMSVEVNYEEAKNLLDIQSFCEYVAFEFYIYNQDSFLGNNNWAMWRVRNTDNVSSHADGLWRMMVYDTEYSTGVYNEGKTFDTDNISEIFAFDSDKHDDTYYMVELFLSLYDNEDFKREFVNTLCDIRNYDFEKSHAMEKTNELAATYKILAKESILRNGPDWVALWQNPDDFYKKKVSELNFFLSGRYMQFLNIASRALGLEKAVDVEVKVNDILAGTVQINNTKLDMEALSGNTFKGIYYPEFPITLTALPVQGHTFDGWKVDGAKVEDLTSATITIDLKGKTTIEAIYK